MQKFNRIKSGNKPLYIDVYDYLFKRIMNGEFPAESKLPAEVELAKTLGVSRMTLRQALSLLQDDGLIKSVHGRGSFVTSNRQHHTTIGLESIGHPLYKSHSKTIDDVEINFRIDVQSDYMKQVLKQDAAAVVAAERWYKSDDQAVAYGFSFMTIEAIAELGVDLNDQAQLLEMLERNVYDLATSISYEVKHSASVNSFSQKYDIAGSDECVLLLESVYSKQAYPIVYNKFYIPKDFSMITINATK